MIRYILKKDLPDKIEFRRYLTSGYYVSDDGRVFSTQSNLFLKGYRGGDYLWFDLWVNGTKIRKSQHRLMAECFVSNPDSLPIVRHLDDNPYNIELTNLAWGTKSDNMNDAVKNGLLKNRPSPKGEKNRKAKLTEQQIISIRSEINSGIHFKDIATKYGISCAYVYNIKSNKAWKHIA